MGIKNTYNHESIITYYSEEHYPGSGILNAEFMDRDRMNEIMSEIKKRNSCEKLENRIKALKRHLKLNDLEETKRKVNELNANAAINYKTSL